MGELVLVRHGQANSGAEDEASYDRLSDLGHDQAQWLGEWLRTHEDPFDHVVMGSLRRHRETAEGIGSVGPAPVVDARLNEMDYFNLAKAHAAHTNQPRPTPETFVSHIKDVMEAWHRAEIRGNETYADFEARVSDMLDLAAVPGRRVLCVTSGGVIGMIARHLLDLDPAKMAYLLVPIKNSSIHRVTVVKEARILSAFNAIPHLRGPDRAHAITEF